MNASESDAQPPTELGDTVGDTLTRATRLLDRQHVGRTINSVYEDAVRAQELTTRALIEIAQVLQRTAVELQIAAERQAHLIHVVQVLPPNPDGDPGGVMSIDLVDGTPTDQAPAWTSAHPGQEPHLGESAGR